MIHRIAKGCFLAAWIYLFVFGFACAINPDIREQIPFFPVFGEVMCITLSNNGSAIFKVFTLILILYTSLSLSAFYSKKPIVYKTLAIMIVTLNALDLISMIIYYLSQGFSMGIVEPSFSPYILLLFFLIELIFSVIVLLDVVRTKAAKKGAD